MEDLLESVNVALLAPDVAAEMRRRLLDLSTATTGAEHTALDNEARKKLLSLGYLIGGASAAGFPERKDPKDMIGIYNDHIAPANSHYSAGRYREAAEAYQLATRLDPTNVTALLYLGHCHVKLGNEEQALTRYARVVGLDPGHAVGHFHLAGYYRRTGDGPGAEAHYLHAIELDPGLAAARNDLAALYIDTGRITEAITQLELAATADSVPTVALCNIGIVLANQGHLDEAVSYRERVLEIDPNSPVRANIERARARRE